MKSKKVKAKLATRQKAWEDLPGAKTLANVKVVNGQAFRRPGSENPRKR